MHLQIALNQPLQVVLAPSTPQLQLVQTHAQGLPGPAATGFDFTQSVAASPWVINHNLGRRVDVEVFSVGGLRMLADVQHVSANQAQIIFSQPTAGYAYIH